MNYSAETLLVDGVGDSTATWLVEFEPVEADDESDVAGVEGIEVVVVAGEADADPTSLISEVALSNDF